MEVKERKLRLREESRTSILEAALSIARAHGWQAVSMRKIAEMIAHTPPVIYDYFVNKDAILMDLARMGFLQLVGQVQKAEQEHSLPEKQLESMWMAYWDYAFAEKELYRLMFGVGTPTCCDYSNMPEADALADLFENVIRQLQPTDRLSDAQLSIAYTSMWASVHGLISLNMVYKPRAGNFNQQALLNAIRNLTASLAE